MNTEFKRFSKAASGKKTKQERRLLAASHQCRPDRPQNYTGQRCKWQRKENLTERRLKDCSPAFRGSTLSAPLPAEETLWSLLRVDYRTVGVGVAVNSQTASLLTSKHFICSLADCFTRCWCFLRARLSRGSHIRAADHCISSLGLRGS